MDNEGKTGKCVDLGENHRNNAPILTHFSPFMHIWPFLPLLWPIFPPFMRMEGENGWNVANLSPFVPIFTPLLRYFPILCPIYPFITPLLPLYCHISPIIGDICPLFGHICPIYCHIYPIYWRYLSHLLPHLPHLLVIYAWIVDENGSKCA